jgi:hypothetical protein
MSSGSTRYLPSKLSTEPPWLMPTLGSPPTVGACSGRSDRRSQVLAARSNGWSTPVGISVRREAGALTRRRAKQGPRTAAAAFGDSHLERGHRATPAAATECASTRRPLVRRVRITPTTGTGRTRDPRYARRRPVRLSARARGVDVSGLDQLGFRRGRRAGSTSATIAALIAAHCSIESWPIDSCGSILKSRSSRRSCRFEKIGTSASATGTRRFSKAAASSRARGARSRRGTSGGDRRATTSTAASTAGGGLKLSARSDVRCACCSARCTTRCASRLGEDR